MGCSPSALRHGAKGANPIQQEAPQNTVQAEKSWTDTPGVPPPVRLEVNATSQSQNSSNPILGDGPTSGLRRRPTVDHYKGAVPPHNETERMEAFTGIGLKNAPHNPLTARLAHVLAKLLQVSCCNIHFINEGIFQVNTSQAMACFKADFTPEDLPRKLSLCTWTLLPEFPEVLIVPDALQDIRFRDHPMIKGEPHFRFYVGCPLVTFQGNRIGSLCCLDAQPRTLTVQDVNMLCNFAELVVREVEKKHVVEDLNRGVLGSVPDKTATSDYYSEGVMIIDAADPYATPIMWLNSICSDIFGIDDETAYKSILGDLVAIVDETEEGEKSKTEQAVTCIREGDEVTLKACKCKTGSVTLVDLRLRPITSDMVDDQMPLIGIPSFIKSAGLTARACTHYFVSVRPTMAGVPGELPEAAEGAESKPEAGAATGIVRMPTITTISKRTPSMAGMLEGVELGQFIITTQRGRLFRGVYNGEPVTVKVVEQQVPGEEPVHNHLCEAQLTDRLTHPNIAITHKTISRTRTTGRSQLRRYKSKKLLVSEGEASQPKAKSQVLEFWLVREYCDKGSLSEAMERGWFMTEDSIINSAPASDMVAVYATARDIACAMAYVHSRDIIHADLRGNSLGLASSAQDQRGFIAKVMDFDVAVNAQEGPVECSSVVTSFTHMAPEMIADKQVTKAVDVYAFGVIMWELVNGEEPWLGLTNDVIIANVVQHKMQLAFSEYEAPAYTELALECMAYDPQARPTFQQIEDRLTQLQSTVQPSSERAFLRAVAAKSV
ncbi:hypothetical protein WJX77_001163 [Trebouxia sp. C0004]